MKSRLLIGVVVAAFALTATTDVVFAKSARHAVRAAHVTPTTFDSGPPGSLKCGKGQVPVLHSMNPTKLKWGCAKAA
jgi:hypothetical protein